MPFLLCNPRKLVGVFSQREKLWDAIKQLEGVKRDYLVQLLIETEVGRLGSDQSPYSNCQFKSLCKEIDSISVGGDVSRKAIIFRNQNGVREMAYTISVWPVDMLCNIEKEKK